MDRIPAESDLLCESCGYDIASLSPSGNCPECGSPIGASLPAHRRGSPWQVRPTLTSWALTNYLMLRRPASTFDRIRMDSRGMRSLLWANLVLAAALLASPWIDTLVGFPARNVRNAPVLIMGVAYAKSASLGVLAVTTLLFILTLVEAMGIMFFGRRRGWRITRRIAWQICAHASIGWVLAAAFTLLSLVIWLNVSYFGLSGWVERAGRPAQYLLGSVPAIGFVAGMLVFEVLVYTGMRRCRYANAPG